MCAGLGTSGAQLGKIPPSPEEGVSADPVMRRHASFPRTQRRFRLAATPRGASAAERQEYGTALRGVDDGKVVALILLEESGRACPKRAEVCFARQ